MSCSNLYHSLIGVTDLWEKFDSSSDPDLTDLNWAPQMQFLKIKRNYKLRLRGTWTAVITLDTLELCPFRNHIPRFSRGEMTNIVLSAWSCQCWWDISWILLFHSLRAIAEHYWHVWKWKHSWERGWWVKIPPFIQSWSPFTDSVGEV